MVKKVKNNIPKVVSKKHEPREAKALPILDLLSLPVEIRLMVYDQIRVNEEIIALRQTCKQVFDEAEDAYFRNFTFLLYWDSDILIHHCLQFVAMSNRLRCLRKFVSEALINGQRRLLQLKKIAKIHQLLIIRDFHHGVLSDEEIARRVEGLPKILRFLLPKLKIIMLDRQCVYESHAEVWNSISHTYTIATLVSGDCTRYTAVRNCLQIPRHCDDDMTSAMSFFSSGLQLSNGIYPVSRAAAVRLEGSLHRENIMKTMCTKQGLQGLWDGLAEMIENALNIFELYQRFGFEYLYDIPLPHEIIEMIQNDKDVIGEVEESNGAGLAKFIQSGDGKWKINDFSKRPQLEE